ncbi:hypothetical protein ACM26V_16790 [Salipaludibacillus sp. HK11]|uniref:hypothetical protein n=1 Tax=Salipaludibacillus sp. HK11 TaxID=3394320 RepID=UPI0039FD19A8
MRKPYNYAVRRTSRYIANSSTRNLNNHRNLSKYRPLTLIELIGGILAIGFWIFIFSQI